MLNLKTTVCKRTASAGHLNRLLALPVWPAVRSQVCVYVSVVPWGR